MPHNIEIKARIESVASFISEVAAVASSEPIEVYQDDTLFSCANGRLKLRRLSATEGELIFYQRPNIAGPKESSYVTAQTLAPDSLREVLSLSYGQVSRVRKHRIVFWARKTRIHLDSVEGLGDFLELEVVLRDDEPSHTGIRAAEDLLNIFRVSDSSRTRTSICWRNALLKLAPNELDIYELLPQDMLAAQGQLLDASGKRRLEVIRREPTVESSARVAG